MVKLKFRPELNAGVDVAHRGPAVTLCRQCWESSSPKHTAEGQIALEGSAQFFGYTRHTRVSGLEEPG